jgi:hypothetical protein
MPSFTEAAPSLSSATVRSGALTYLPEPTEQQAPATMHTSEFRRAAIPWWLWWNVLSLDAPAVACVWSVLLLRSGGFQSPGLEVVALILSVWVIYTTDRLLDGFQSSQTSRLQIRHNFTAKHRRVFVAFAVSFGVALLWISVEKLEAQAMRAGIFLGLIVVFYLISIHTGFSRLLRWLPKEVSVGIIFAAGTSIPLWSRLGRMESHIVIVWLSFGALCSLNCLSIECWERPRHGAERVPTSRWIAWADGHLNHIALGLATGASLMKCLPSCRNSSGRPLLAVSLAAFLTMILNRRRNSLSPGALRVLADAALVLPALLTLALLP